MRTPARLLAAVALCASPLCAQDAGPLTVLAQPGLPGRFCLFADGSLRVGATGLLLSDWLADASGVDRPAAPPSARFSWLAPGARVVQSVRTEGDLEVTTLTGAGGHGAIGKQRLWLFRSVRLGNTSREKRVVTLCVAVSRGGAVLRDDLALLDGEDVLLVASRKPDDVREVAGETVLAFDLALAPQGTAGFFLAAPAEPTRYRPADVPDVRNLNPDFRLGAIVQDWQDRVLPERLTVANVSIAEAFHAAVGSLLIDPPPAAGTPDAAATLSALARAGHAPQLAGTLEALVSAQAADGRFAGVTDVGLQADLTTALADCALFSEAPERWAPILWRPISRSTAALETADAPAPVAARVALALSRAADVARAVDQTARADELRSRAAALAPVGDASPLGSTFEVRARALCLLSHNAAPPPVDEAAPLQELLPAAHLAVLAGDPEARQQAWRAVRARLEAQPLPAMPMVGEREDTRAAAQFIFLLADSLVRAETDAVHLLPALPADWTDAGALAGLTDLPSGLGSIRMEVAATREGATTLSLPKAPKLARRLLVSPPLGREVGGVRANGRLLPPEALQAGPPWELDASIWSISLLPPP